jgi:hypothetical protein
MATLSIVSNGVTLNPQPELPVDREDLAIEESKRMRNGQLRVAHVAVKKRLRYGVRNLTEAQRTSWLSAHPLNTTFSHTDELGVTRTVKCVSRRDPLTRTQPSVGGTPAFYALEVELEEV